MANARAHFLVGVLTKQNQVQWVTQINYSKHFAAWEAHKKAAELTMYDAKHIYDGLRDHGHSAILVREDRNREYYNRGLTDSTDVRRGTI